MQTLLLSTDSFLTGNSLLPEIILQWSFSGEVFLGKEAAHEKNTAKVQFTAVAERKPLKIALS